MLIWLSTTGNSDPRTQKKRSCGVDVHLLPNHLNGVWRRLDTDTFVIALIIESAYSYYFPNLCLQMMKIWNVWPQRKPICQKRKKWGTWHFVNVIREISKDFLKLLPDHKIVVVSYFLEKNAIINLFIVKTKTLVQKFISSDNNLFKKTKNTETWL